MGFLDRNDESYIPNYDWFSEKEPKKRKTPKGVLFSIFFLTITFIFSLPFNIFMIATAEDAKSITTQLIRMLLTLIATFGVIQFLAKTYSKTNKQRVILIIKNIVRTTSIIVSIVGMVISLQIADTSFVYYLMIFSVMTLNIIIDTRRHLKEKKVIIDDSEK